MTSVSVSHIPHRPPFLFVDEVLEVGNDRLTARFEVQSEADFFRGHYPGRPVMPGVLICEAIFQAGALLISHLFGHQGLETGVPVLTRIQDARFRRMVTPGEVLELEAVLDEQVDNAFYMKGSARVGTETAVKVLFVCMLAREENAS